MKLLLLFLVSMLLVLTTPVHSDPPSAPATQPSKLAAQRAAALKKNLHDFSLNLDLCGSPANRPEYTRLILAVTLQDHGKWLHGWLESSITEAEAGTIIDYLATEGFLDQASPNDPAKPFKWPDGPCYVMSVPGLYQDLGWDLTMLRRLDALRKTLTGDAAKNMDLILTSLAKQREEWTKSAASTAPRAETLPAADAFKMSYVFPLTRIDIEGSEFKYGWSVAKDNSSPVGNPGDYIGRAVYGTLTPAQQARAKALAQRLLALDAPAGDSFPPADPKSYPAAFHGSLKVLVGATTRTVRWTGDSKVPPELDTIVHDLTTLAEEARPGAWEAWTGVLSALQAADKTALAKVTTDQGHKSVMTVYGRGREITADEMRILARAWGQWELRFTVKKEDAAHANAGPPIKEAGLDFVKTADGWKLDQFTAGE